MQQTADTTDFNPAAPISDDGTLLTAGYRLDEYEIESVLAVGDFRITYYAWDHRGDRNVVIHEYYPRSLCVRGDDKISVTSQSKERFTDFEFGLSEFLLEARLVSQIRSPYLPNVIEYREANGTGYLVSEYDDGRTLAEWLKKDPNPLSETQVNEILNSSLQGLRELHARNLLHTSVSPTNLFIRYHGHPVLLGQGLARYRLAQYTKTYTISLRPGYTPLEQYGLDGNIGPWTDLYALGASLYECVAGIRPIDASARHTSLIKGEQDPLTPAVEIAHGSYSNLLLSNIDWMLKPYLEERPDSADLMLGVVSFQKQSKFKKSALSETKPSPLDKPNADNETEVGLLTNSPDSDQKSVESIAQIDNQTVVVDDGGRKFYWGLGLLLLAFLSVTAYQIYKHEFSPELTSASEPESTDTLFKPEEVSPPPIQSSDENSTAIATENRMISRESDEQRREFYENVYKEDEVKRRVEEELAALKLAEQAELQRQEVDKRLEIEQLLNKADDAVKGENLLTPDGRSAFDFYSTILDIDSGNEKALTGLNEIADNYFNKAIDAIDNADPDAAGNYLKSLIQVRPDDPRLDGFLQQIIDLKAKIKLDKVTLELEKKAEEQRQAEIQRLAQEKLEEEEQLRLEKLAEQQKKKNTQTELSNINSAATELPETPIEQTQIQAETQVDVDKQTENQTNELDNETLSDNRAPQITPPAQSRQATPTISTAKIRAAYKRYDRGEFSGVLFNDLFEAANSGDGRSQYLVAEMYAAGRGIEQNFAESTYWLKKSLDYVNKNAQFRQAWAEKAMGVIYEKGWYVDSNPERAVRWYRSSADKNYAPAQYRLGLAYAKGLGVNKDNEQAAQWLKKALSNGNLEAKKALTKLPSQN